MEERKNNSRKYVDFLFCNGKGFGFADCTREGE